MCSGIFVGGKTPVWLVASRGTLVAHVMDCDGAVAGFTPFHNIGCPHVRKLLFELMLVYPASFPRVWRSGRPIATLCAEHCASIHDSCLGIEQSAVYDIICLSLFLTTSVVGHGSRASSQPALERAEARR